MAVAGRSQALDELLREIGPLWQRDIRSAGDRIKEAYLPLLMAAPRRRDRGPARAGLRAA